MTIEDKGIVDLISTDPGTGRVVLSISDHLPWRGVDDHLLLLQEKLNSYVAFIENGGIYENYPAARNKPLRIEVVCLYPLDAAAEKFISSAAAFLEKSGWELTYRTLEA